MTASLFEYRSWIMDKLMSILNKHKEYDYIKVFGIQDVYLNILKHNPLAGSSYVEIPKVISNSKGVINIENKDDDKCFLWCCIASRHLPPKNRIRVSKYKKYESEFNCGNLPFPMPIQKIPIFERLNNVRIDVYTCDEEDNKNKYWLYLSKNKEYKEHIRLFWWKQHYCLITAFSRFVGGDHKNICPNCLKSYSDKKYYHIHLKDCEKLNENGSNVICSRFKPVYANPEAKGDDRLPVIGWEKPITKFNNYKEQKRLPVVIYADFESYFTPATEEDKKLLKSAVAKHIPYSFRIRIKSDVDLGNIALDYEYVGENADVEFMNIILELESVITRKLLYLYKKHAKHNLTEDEEQSFQNASKCIFCNKDLGKDRVRDHDHFTGKYCGPAHNMCNQKAIQQFNGKILIPVLFHNANYDMKMFMSAFRTLKGDEYVVEKMDGIPCNMETFKCLDINNLRIIDSHAHLSMSLEKLIGVLPPAEKKLLNTIGSNDIQNELVGKKGNFPYEKDYGTTYLKFTNY